MKNDHVMLCCENVCRYSLMNVYLLCCLLIFVVGNSTCMRVDTRTVGENHG